MARIKVVMGFIEIAAALKFLSNADLTWTWGVLKFEVFLAMWVVLALATGIYLLGKIRFPHDTPIKKFSAVRIAFAVLVLFLAAFSVRAQEVLKNDGYGSLSGKVTLDGNVPAIVPLIGKMMIHADKACCLDPNDDHNEGDHQE